MSNGLKTGFVVGGYNHYQMPGCSKSDCIVKITDISESGQSAFIEYVPSGGSSGWWPKESFSPITDARLCLVALRHQRATEHAKAKREFEVAERRLQEANRALELAEESIKAGQEAYAPPAIEPTAAEP